MSTWLNILLQSPAGAPTGGTTGPGSGAYQIVQYLPMILIIGVLFFFMFSAKRRQDKERQNLLSNVKKGDNVQMIGGERGRIMSITADEVLLKVDESSNTKITYDRNAIARVIEENKTEAK